MSEQAAAAASMPGAAGNVVTRNPNASIALGSGSGCGALVIWLFGIGGVQVPPEVAAVIGAVAAASFLLIGRRGIKGAILGLWRGDQA
jgi:hypothetical protein